MEGLPTTGGMELLHDFHPGEDATVVKRFRQAGAVLISKLHMTEGATWLHHPAFPRPTNPWSAEHWTGVSSSGSGVAVAAGLCFAAIGSDTGGSIRMPSSANNLTGIKPTWGRVSRHGIVHLCESFDHIGPMARSAEDAAALLLAIAGADPRDPTTLTDPVPDYLAQMSRGVGGMTLGLDRSYATNDMASEIVAAIDQAVEVFRALGMRVQEVTFPWCDADSQIAMAMFSAEMLHAHSETYPAQQERYGPELRALLGRAAETRGIDVAASSIARDRFRGQLRTMFAGVDMILVPGLGRILPTWEAMDELSADKDFDPVIGRFTFPFNFSGIPTISLPGGFSVEGLPIGIQLAAPWLAESSLIRAGVAFQRATDFHKRRAPLKN